MAKRNLTRLNVVRLAAGITLTAAGMTGFTLADADRAHADEVAYLVNVTMRPGYDFPDAPAALCYGYGVCDKVASGRAYTELIGDIMRDFRTGDEYQGAYLINQAVNELCPAHVWQLRRSAEGYRGGEAL
jgi:hypothetical protein